MNPLYEQIQSYSGWEKHFDKCFGQIFTNEIHQDRTVNVSGHIQYTFFYESKPFWGKAKIHTGKITCYGWRSTTPEKKEELVTKVRVQGRRYIDEIKEYLAKNKSENTSKQMIELAEMSLVSSDPSVKDAFIVKYLELVKPIKKI